MLRQLNWKMRLSQLLSQELQTYLIPIIVQLNRRIHLWLKHAIMT